MQKSIYQLKLHERINLDFGITIMRVPGGWIYDCWDYDTDQFKTGIFIPFNNEYQVKSQELPLITGEAQTNGQLSSSNGFTTQPLPDPLKNMKKKSRRLLRALLVQYKGDEKDLDMSVRRLAVDNRVTNVNSFLKEICSRGLCELNKSDHKKRKRILSFRLTVPSHTQEALQV